MAEKDFNKAEPDKKRLSTTEARQGKTLGEIRWVLIISFILAAIALFLVYLLF